jgi:hypothetical protein
MRASVLGGRLSMKERAVCVRCGSVRTGFDSVCPSCGHNPSDEGLLVAWLLSENHLNEVELNQSAARILSGEFVQPSDRLLKKARIALGNHFSSDPGMTVPQRLGVLSTSLLLTPLVGWTLWFWWRRRRPRAAWQAFGLSAPATLLFSVLLVWLRLTGT